MDYPEYVHLGALMADVNLDDLLARPEWHQRAACRGVGTDVFYVERGGRPDVPPRKAALPLFEAEAAKRKAQAPGELRGAKKSLGADLPHENEAVLERWTTGSCAARAAETAGTSGVRRTGTPT
jgi:hypothetical protein